MLDDVKDKDDAERLKQLLSSIIFNLTFIVICEADETLVGKACQNLDIIREFEQSFMDGGYNTRIFDPAGQGDIGGGCGQLHYVQQYLNKK